MASKRSNIAIFIEGLPVECMETDLIKLLQPCGKVNAVAFHRQPSMAVPNLRPNTISATVEFQVRDHAEAAVYLLENSLVWNRHLSARIVNPPSNATASNSSGQSIASSGKALRSAQVHISYLSKQLATIVTEQTIIDLFSTFGKVIEVSLKKKCVDTEMCIQNGYGFVHFPLTSEGIESALRAVDTLHQVTINNVSYDCSVSNQLKQVLVSTGRLRADAVSSGSTSSSTSGHMPTSSVSSINMAAPGCLGIDFSAPAMSRSTSFRSWWEDGRGPGHNGAIPSSEGSVVSGSSHGMRSVSSQNQRLLEGNGDNRPGSLFGRTSAPTSPMFPPIVSPQQSPPMPQYGPQDGLGTWGANHDGNSIARSSYTSGATSQQTRSLDGSLSVTSSLGDPSHPSFKLNGSVRGTEDFMLHSGTAPGLFGSRSTHSQSSNGLSPQQLLLQQQLQQQYQQQSVQQQGYIGGASSVTSGRSSNGSHSSMSSGWTKNGSTTGSKSYQVPNVPLIAEEDNLYTPPPLTSSTSNSRFPGVFNKWF